jgi:hypothetical protein
VLADNLAEDEINCENFTDSRSTPRLAAALPGEENIMVVVLVVVVKVVDQFEFGDGREQSCSDKLCL